MNEFKAILKETSLILQRSCEEGDHGQPYTQAASLPPFMIPAIAGDK